MADSPAASPASNSSVEKAGLLHHPALRQFIKFSIVGASSTIISLAVVYFVLKVLHIDIVLHNALSGSPRLQDFVDSNHLYLQVAGTIAFCFGVTNGFIWNSRWTFRQANPQSRHLQYFRFFAVNIAGLVFNWIVTFVLMQIFAGGRTSAQITWQDDAAIFGAIFIVAFWNFSANKLWTFKSRSGG